MSSAAPLQNTAAHAQPASDLLHPGLLLQRKCACGSAQRSLAGVCEECKSRQGLQAKLSIGASNDPLEQEADRVADQVLAAPASPAVGTTAPLIQRYATQPSAHSDAVPSSVDSVLASAGKPLDAALQQDMGQRFHYNFSQVKIHTGPAADQSADEVNAKAYTVGNNVVFGAGKFAPGTQAGRKLIAHELTHVVQQSGPGLSAGVIARAPADETPWVQDQEGGLYYKTQAEAEARMAALEKKGEWQHLRVTSFKLKSKTYWRVEMRGRKSVAAPVPTPAPTAPAPKASPGTATPGATGGTTAASGGATRIFSLTFDDGPHADTLGAGKNLTENVLDTLKTKGVKAGFFIQTGVSFRGANKIGRTLVARMQAEGHTVGIHTGGTKDHETHTSAQKAGRLESELKAGQSYITTQTGTAPTLVRPPFGTSNSAVDAVYKKVGLTNLLWDIDGDKGASSLAQLKTRLDSTDPRDPGIPAVQARGWSGTTAASPKIVVLYHDIRANTSSNIGDVIDHIRAETKTVSKGKDTADFAPP